MDVVVRPPDGVDVFSQRAFVAFNVCEGLLSELKNRLRRLRDRAYSYVVRTVKLDQKRPTLG